MGFSMDFSFSRISVALICIRFLLLLKNQFLRIYSVFYERLLIGRWQTRVANEQHLSCKIHGRRETTFKRKDSSRIKPCPHRLTIIGRHASGRIPIKCTSAVKYFIFHPLRWKTRETLAGKNSQEKCAFYLVWEATIPLYDAEIYDTVLDTVTRTGESRKFENTRRLSKSPQSHVKKSRVVKNRSEIPYKSFIIIIINFIVKCIT